MWHAQSYPPHRVGPNALSPYTVHGLYLSWKICIRTIQATCYIANILVASQDGKQPLHHAAAAGSVGIASTLMDANAPFDVCDKVHLLTHLVSCVLYYLCCKAPIPYAAKPSGWCSYLMCI